MVAGEIAGAAREVEETELKNLAPGPRPVGHVITCASVGRLLALTQLRDFGAKPYEIGNVQPHEPEAANAAGVEVAIT